MVSPLAQVSARVQAIAGRLANGRWVRATLIALALAVIAVVAGAATGLTSAGATPAHPATQVQSAQRQSVPAGSRVLVGLDASGKPVASLYTLGPMVPPKPDGGNNYSTNPINFGGCNSSDSSFADNSNWLPVNRWGGATGTIHTRLSANPISDLSSKIQRGFLESGALSIGNAFWQGAVGMTSFATRFCLQDTVGRQADAYGAAIGHALLSSGFIAALVGFGLIMLLWRGYRTSESPTRRLVKVCLVLGVFTVMLVGADATHTNGGATSYGALSPGWLASRLNITINTLASAPAAALSGQVQQLTYLDNPEPSNQLSCSRYVSNLLAQYDQSFGFDKIAQSQSAVPKALDAMWETTGLAAYINVQFGSNNPYGKVVYCHVLDNLINAPVQDQRDPVSGNAVPGQISLTRRGTTVPAPDPNSLAFTPSTNKEEDRSVIGWAACEWNGHAWTVDAQWGQVTHQVNDEAQSYPITASWCAGQSTPAGGSWWATSKSSFDSGSSPFDWEDNADAINGATASQPQVRDFLLNWHGNANQVATTMAIIYAIASFVMLIIFGILSLAIIVAKIAMIVMVMLAFVLLAASLFPSQAENNRALMAFKHYLSMALFAFGASLLLSLIAIITQFVEAAGTGQFGPGSVMNVLWAGFSPITACLIVHHLFKVLKAPSPFKPTSALAWGAAASGIGIAAGIGLDSLVSRHTNRLKGSVRNQAQRRFSSLIGAGAPGKAGRRNTMNGAVGAAPAGRGAGSGTAGVPNGGPGHHGDAPGAVAPGAVAPAAVAAPSLVQRQRDEAQEQRAARIFARQNSARMQVARAAGRGARSAAAWAGANIPAAAAASRVYGSVRDKYASARGWVASAASQAAQTPLGRRMVAAARWTRTSPVGQRVGLAWDRFRANPVRKSLKVAGTTAAIMALPIASVPALGAAAGLYGVRKANHARKNRPAARAERNRERLERYRASRQQQPGVVVDNGEAPYDPDYDLNVAPEDEEYGPPIDEDYAPPMDEPPPEPDYQPVGPPEA